MALTEKIVCDRCGEDQNFRVGRRFEKQRLFKHIVTDDFGEEIELMLCWDCDWDLSNGCEPFEDPVEIYWRRREEAYAYDPVNNDPPY